MRTPGEDQFLAIGYLYAEGIIQSKKEIKSISVDEDIINVFLKKELKNEQISLNRNDFASAACGMCGKESLESVYFPKEKISSPVRYDGALIHGLSDKLRREQLIFQKTGGIHASALFSKEGQFLKMAEDIGRHNSLDKIIGWALSEDEFDFSTCMLLVSGRAGFELIQKSIVAGIPLMVAVGAPSSMAIEYAEEYALTLVGFAKKESYNVYTHSERIH